MTQISKTRLPLAEQSLNLLHAEELSSIITTSAGERFYSQLDQQLHDSARMIESDLQALFNNECGKPSGTFYRASIRLNAERGEGASYTLHQIHLAGSQDHKRPGRESFEICSNTLGQNHIVEIETYACDFPTIKARVNNCTTFDSTSTEPASVEVLQRVIADIEQAHVQLKQYAKAS